LFVLRIFVFHLLFKEFVHLSPIPVSWGKILTLEFDDYQMFVKVLLTSNKSLLLHIME
jgi:hypothetical protein